MPSLNPGKDSKIWCECGFLMDRAAGSELWRCLNSACPRTDGLYRLEDANAKDNPVEPEPEHAEPAPVKFTEVEAPPPKPRGKLKPPVFRKPKKQEPKHA